MRSRLLLGVAIVSFCSLLRGAAPASIPVLVDTDIGTDIDDAFALALIVKSPEFKVLGVTTVAGDTQARARLAAKLLWAAGGRWREVPVYAGNPGPEQTIDQAPWAAGFSSPALHLEGAVEFLRAEIDRAPGQVTVVALGELTNLAALLREEPAIAGKIKEIVMMGGSVFRGYDPGSKPVPEWNIKSNIGAAQAVFAAGIPILLAPLDSTIALRLDPAERERIFLSGGAVAESLQALYGLWLPSDKWNHGTPILYDALPVALLLDQSLAVVRPLQLQVDSAGLTRVSAPGVGAPTRVATEADPATFIRFFQERVSR